MDKRSTSLQFAAQQVLHQLTVQRLVQRVYEQRLIGNVERGAYVECMIELALKECHPAWSLTATWDSCDLVNRKTGARIEIKQSAALQTWHLSSCPNCGSLYEWDVRDESGKASPQFSIKQREVDLYVFAWHPEKDPEIAGHRRPDQWKFFVVAETCLPERDGGIGLGPLNQLIERGDLAEYGGYDALAAMVANVLEALPSLKAGPDRGRSA